MSIERLTLIVFENIKQSQLTGGPRTLVPSFLITSAIPSTASISPTTMQWRG